MTLVAVTILALAAGAVLGTIFYGGLWFTLRRLPGSPSPARLMITSYFWRMAVCLASFYLIARAGGWQALVICMAGFLAARTVMVRRFGPGEGRTAFKTGREANRGNQS